MNRHPFFLISFLLTVSMLVSCGGEKTVADTSGEEIKLIKYGEVTQSGGIQTRSFNGVTQSASETKLSFRSSGLIVKMRVKVGQQVKKGQTLAELDMQDASLNYEKAKASEQSASIQLETSKSNLDRVKKLYQSGSSSLSDYENAKNSYATALASYESAKKSLDLQGSQFQYARIKSPMNGLVSQVNAEVNEFAQAGSPVIVINSGDGQMEVNVGVPESYIAKLTSGQSVQVQISDIALSGTITEVGYSTSGASTYPVIIKLDQANDRVRPGMPAKVSFSFDTGKEEQHLLVPVPAVGDNGESNFVFKLVPEGTDGVYVAKETKVELGHVGDSGFVLLFGLEEGDLVAIAGLRSLFDGRKVRLLDKTN